MSLVETRGRPRNGANPWTPERLDTLKSLWGLHHSASEIAGIVGGGLTRNAVIGKARRLNLLIVGHVKGGRKPGKPKRTEAQRAESLSVINLIKSRKKYEAKVPVYKKQPIIEPTPESAVTLADAKPNHCRWVIGNPKGFETLFCGAEKIKNCSYCAWHARIAHTPYKERREYRPTFSRFSGYKVSAG